MSLQTPKSVMSSSSLTSLDNSALDHSLKKAEEETDRIVADMLGGVGQRFQAESVKLAERAKAERTRALLELMKKHELSEGVVDDLLNWVHLHVLPGSPDASMSPASSDFAAPPVAAPAMSNTTTPSIPSTPTNVKATAVAVSDPVNAFLLPKDVKSARSFLQTTPHKPRPRAAAFSHSLERNGANNLLLYLVREFKDDLSFTVVSPKEGAMRADYEAMGVRVVICSMKSPTYCTDVRHILASNAFEYTIANTIMTAEAVRACKEQGIPSLWLIHEAWPHDQLDYYARDVFLMPPQVLDSTVIKSAFQSAERIVFPAHVQRQCYQTLFEPGRANVIYNGIPLDSINAFRASRDRDAVRADLGYGPDDFVLAQLGTVCKRKGQIVTCEAFAQLHETHPKMKLIMVGARYIRQHEIDYINECKATLEAVGATEKTTILDVKKNVLPYYYAADIILVPSFNEVLPLVICEAMAFERPVIASRIDGIPEALEHNTEGMLMEAGNVKQLVDFIEVLHDDPSLRQSMGARGRQRVLSQFSFDTMSKNYRDAISHDMKIDLTAPKQQ